jgi:crotonobetainyl-CoA:carnitine CoA-transferase CaiB-like acyl-CoA transferase
MMSVTGLPDGMPGSGPMKTGPSLVDICTGLNAAIAILAALYHRDARGGPGQYADVALFDTAIAMQSHMVANYLISAEQPVRTGNAGNGGHPAAVYRCLDGEIYIAAGQNNFFRSLCKVLGCEHVVPDPRFVSIVERSRHRQQLDEVLIPLVRTWRVEELLAALEDARVPCSIINDYDRVFRDPQVRDRQVLRHFPGGHGVAGPVPTIANPIRLSHTPVRYETPPPAVGEHTEAVLTEVLGRDEQGIRDLRAAAVC